MYSWSLSQAFGMDYIPVCWKLVILPCRSFVFAQWEEFGVERHGTLVPRADGFLVLIKPLFRLPQEGERKQAEPDGVSRSAPYGYGLAQLQEILEMGIGVLILLATEWARLHHVYEAGLQLKFHIPNINIGSSYHIGS